MADTPVSDAVADEERRHEFASLTPMQQLVLEVLASRYRLGHRIWTFSMNQALPKALKSLAADGYVESIPGVVQGTVRAMLTPKGRDLALDPHYVPPILEKENPQQHAT